MKRLRVMAWLGAAVGILAGVTLGMGTDTVQARGGDHLPVPFKALNTKVELAEGEYYVLEGTVVVTTMGTYLEIDLEAHPWLATAKRRAFPYYFLDGGIVFWRKYEGVRVRVQGQAFTQPDGTIGLKLLPNSKKGMKAIY